MSDEYLYINPEQFRTCMAPCYLSHPELMLNIKSLEDPAVQKLHSTLGLEFSHKDFDIFGTTHVYKIIDKQLYFLAKIKFGI